jgi:hypothetical protein
MTGKRLAIFTGHSVTNDESSVEGYRVRFKTPDGRCMFEVKCADDGKSLEVSAVESCIVGGVLHDTRLMVSPRVSNVVHISTHEYEK